MGQSTHAKHRVKAFVLRQGRRYPGRAGWTRPYRRWLADLSVPLAPQHIALQAYRDTIDETERRVERLTDQLRQLTPTWRWAPVVEAPRRCVGSRLLRPSASSRRSATFAGSLIRARSWPPSASCRRSTRAGRVFAAAGSPRRGIRTRGGCWRKLGAVRDIGVTDTSVPRARQSATNYSLGGTQPADISSVNRR